VKETGALHVNNGVTMMVRGDMTAVGKQTAAGIAAINKLSPLQRKGGVRRNEEFPHLR
jgi:hypothetical protein